MLHKNIEDGEVVVALRSLRKEDQALIDPALAQKALELVLKKLESERPIHIGPLDAIRFAINELFIANQRQREKRQKVFGAYWRLLRRLLDNRERRARPSRRGKEAA